MKFKSDDFLPILPIAYIILYVILLISTIKITLDKKDIEVYIVIMPTTIVAMPNPTPNPDIMYISNKASKIKSFILKSDIIIESPEQEILLKSTTENYLGFVDIDGQYVIRLGTFYTNRIGQQFIITFKNGNSISVIVGGIIKDEDMINGQYFKKNGSIIEFVMSDNLDVKIKRIGDVSKLINNGKIIEINRLG